MAITKPIPEPLHPSARDLEAPAGGLRSYPPTENWEDWSEYDPRVWPRKVKRNYSLIPTICFNCEAGCGLLAYVDKETLKVRKFEGNPNTREAADAIVRRDPRRLTRS